MNLNADDSISWNFIGIVTITHFIPQKLSFAASFFNFLPENSSKSFSNQEPRRKAFKHFFFSIKGLAEIF